MGKGEIACTRNFSFSHNVFLKASFPDTSKCVIVWEWVTAKVMSGRSVKLMCFLAFFHQYFPKPLTTFLTCFSRGERRKYAGKKFRLNSVSNSQPPGHESDMLTTKPPKRFGWLFPFIYHSYWLPMRATPSEDG